ncbi:zinc finger protein basonuclin-2-like [Paralichthys olivaceus]|uniref:zinc finger protein basonuclin-2-like n=1 Tax=Paralichthys olivaceus TaxID=8255 RepID=UPI0037537AC6
MVFSSLRSRNRHSANPNPRLHTGSVRDPHPHRNTQPEAHTQEKERSKTVWQPDDDTHRLVHVHNFRNGLNRQSNLHRDNMSSDSPLPSPHPPPLVNSQNFTQSDSSCRSDLHLQVLPHPPPRVQALSASSVGSTSLVSAPAAEITEPCRHLLGLNTNHTAPAPLHDQAPVAMENCNTQYGRTEGKHDEIATQQQWESGDSIPKKKPRKSSMPVKIERVKQEGRRNVEGEEG